ERADAKISLGFATCSNEIVHGDDLASVEGRTNEFPSRMHMTDDLDIKLALFAKFACQPFEEALAVLEPATRKLGKFKSTPTLVAKQYLIRVIDKNAINTHIKLFFHQYSKWQPSSRLPPSSYI